jgi:hypothetical protein
MTPDEAQPVQGEIEIRKYGVYVSSPTVMLGFKNGILYQQWECRYSDGIEYKWRKVEEINGEV